ncbi:MAG TPA: hypothetical protein VD768_01895 [Sphingomicrobium sp.]|nr:hypothetical protein [Sphingomicrobium sp.]
MNDDDTTLLASRDDRANAELLLYDFFKFLTSMSLLTLGGMLAISQSVDRGDIAPFALIVVLLIISGGGISSFVGAGEIVKQRYTGSPSRSLEFHRKAAPSMLAIGIGMFLGVYVDTLT